MRIVIIVLDGCCADKIDDAGASLSFFNEIREEGYASLDCRAVFPTATYTGHSSIITGSYPAKTGLIANQYYDRSEGVRKHFDDVDPGLYIQMPTIFEYLNELNPISVCEPVNKGAKTVVASKEVNEHQIKERNMIIFNKSVKLITSEDSELIMINFSGVDSVGEVYGPNSREYAAGLTAVDGYVKRIYEESQAIDDTLLFITADHGLTEIEECYNLQDDLWKNQLEAISMPSHRISHIYLQKNNESELNQYLKKNRRIKHVIDKSQMLEFKINHERCGDLVVVAEEKTELEVSGLKGSHGGLTVEELKVPLLILLPKNYKLDLSDSKIIDILPTILDLKKIVPTKELDGRSLLVR